jgi:hypothetical protein
MNDKAPTVYIIDPQGCGKTRNAEALRKMFGCTQVIDDWEGTGPIQAGSLVLIYDELILNRRNK